MEEEAFAAYLANQGVVRAALRRAGVRRNHDDYEDLYAEAVLRYVAHYRRLRPRYQGADLNRLIGWQLRYDVLHLRQRNSRHRLIEDKALVKTPTLAPQEAERIDTTAVEVAALLARLLAHLPPREQQILRLRYEEGLNNRELAARLHLSPARIGQLVKHIRQVYQALDL